MFNWPGTASLVLAAAIFGPTAGPELPTGPWRQIIEYKSDPDAPNGISLWVLDSSVLPEGESASSEEHRDAFELWVNHGNARIGGQAYRIYRTRYFCREGGMTSLRQTAFSAGGALLESVVPNQSRQPVYPHSAEREVMRAVCDSGNLARRGDSAQTVAQAIAADPEGPLPDTPVPELQIDLDADGKADQLVLRSVPDSTRIDVDVRLSRKASEPFRLSLAAPHRPAHAPAQRAGFRKAFPNEYLYACERKANSDVEPCESGVASVTRGGVEIIVPGHPSLLLWVPDQTPKVVRLPSTPAE